MFELFACDYLFLDTLWVCVSCDSLVLLFCSFDVVLLWIYREAYLYFYFVLLFFAFIVCFYCVLLL